MASHPRLVLISLEASHVVLYWVGWHWGEHILNWRAVRLVLTPKRAQWLQAAYRRHALKTVVTVRHVMGLRAAAFLTGGWRAYHSESSSSPTRARPRRRPVWVRS